MVDVLTTAQRSYNMSCIRSRDTGPETRLKELLISKGLGDFEMQPKRIPGKPDFYFAHRRFAVFVDGCFWHGCKDCYQIPKTNTKFWDLKIEKNIVRDRVVDQKLKALGITVIRVKEHELKKNQNVVLNKIKKKLKSDQRPKVLDLFAGAGGLSEGFVRAGCNVIGHIEMDADACSTLATRMIYHALNRKGKLVEYQNYILGKISRNELIEKYGLQRERDSVIRAEIGKANYGELIQRIRNRLNGARLDIIVGGPPCQAYSQIGRSVDNHNMKRDNRNYLYRYYIEFLKALKPKIFVFENVPGLKSAGNGKYLNEMRSLMKQAGYTTDFRILNAADFGVPQSRNRVILIGWNNKSKLRDYPEFTALERKYLVKDVFAGLPVIQAGEGKEMVLNFAYSNTVLENLRIVNSKFNVLMEHIARPNNRRDLEIYRLVVMAKNQGINFKYRDLPQRLKTHKNETGFLDRFKVIDGNARGSHTVLAHAAKDGHYYIHPDIKQNRSLTVRELARLQTFPDDYKFEGTRSSQMRQIGNAVPVKLSNVLATELIKHV